MKMMNDTSRMILELLENTSFAENIRSYSGRGMDGALCLGVEIPRNSLFELGYEMARSVYRDVIWSDTSIIPAPHTDSMGHDMIVYWPGAKVQETEEVDQ
jgi:hypothetical protein